MQQAKLTASDSAAGDSFGESVSVSGDTVVVGAFTHDCVVGADCGAAYVFVRSETTWVQQAKFFASDAAADDIFGCAVSISGDTAVIGARLKDDAGLNSGSAYVFVSDGGVWTQQAKLTPNDAAAWSFFGNSVSVSGDTAVIGAYQDNDGVKNSGSVYVFVRSGTTWTQQAKLRAADAATWDQLGWSVSLDGDTAIAGAYHKAAAYVFVRNGTTWMRQAKLTATDAADSVFGYSISVCEDTAVIGALGGAAGSACFLP